MSKAILAAIIGATKQKPQGAKEEEQVFLNRLVVAMEKVPDASYEKLSAETQEWHAAAVEAVSKKEDIPSLAEEDPSVAETEATATKGKKGTAKKPAAAPPSKASAKKPVVKPVAAAKKPTVAKEKADPKLRVRGDEPGETAADMTKYLVCKNPKTTPEQILETLKGKKIEASEALVTVECVRTKRVIQFLGALGKLK